MGQRITPFASCLSGDVGATVEVEDWLELSTTSSKSGSSTSNNGSSEIPAGMN